MKAMKRLNSMGTGTRFLFFLWPLHCLGCSKISNIAEAIQLWCESQRQRTRSFRTEQNREGGRQRKHTSLANASQTETEWDGQREQQSTRSWDTQRQAQRQCARRRGRATEATEMKFHSQAFLFPLLPPVQVGPVYPHLWAPTMNNNYTCFLQFMPLLNY